MNITFDQYLMFLYNCFNKKIPDVNNINSYNGLDIPVWFGNCSNVKLNVTDKNGNFCSHIMSQKYCLSHIINKITCKNVFLIDIKNLSTILEEKTLKRNDKEKKEYNISTLHLASIKKNKIIVSEKSLNLKQKIYIKEIYEEDIIFIKNLKEKYITIS